MAPTVKLALPAVAIVMSDGLDVIEVTDTFAPFELLDIDELLQVVTQRKYFVLVSDVAAYEFAVAPDMDDHDELSELDCH